MSDESIENITIIDLNGSLSTTASMPTARVDFTLSALYWKLDAIGVVIATG